MADMFDYLDWFGDFDFETVPFNEVDNLILAQVSYLPLLDVVPAPGEGSVSLAEAANRYVEKFPSSAPARLGPLLSARTNDLLGHMASCGRRYADMQLGAYEEVLDEGTHEQFGAITFELPDGSIYVAFRGTDSSLEGWLEDCEISYKVIPSQTHALAYLRAVVAAAKKTDGQGQVRVGGHSKGGNLAAYAASRLSEGDRSHIRAVWCNDSPGFCDEVVSPDSLRCICERTHLFTPEYSVVGSLFNHAVMPRIIQSSGVGVMEHSAVEWQVMRGSFIEGRQRSDSSVRVVQAFNQLIDSRDLPGRRKLLDDLYEALHAQGIYDIDDMMSRGLPGLNATMTSINSLTPEDRQTMTNFLLGIAGGSISGAVNDAVAPVAQQLGEAWEDAKATMQERMRENAAKALQNLQSRQHFGE